VCAAIFLRVTVGEMDPVGAGAAVTEDADANSDAVGTASKVAYIGCAGWQL
jgi:serine acetyltransferase